MFMSVHTEQAGHNKHRITALENVQLERDSAWTVPLQGVCLSVRARFKRTLNAPVAFVTRFPPHVGLYNFVSN